MKLSHLTYLLLLFSFNLLHAQKSEIRLKYENEKIETDHTKLKNTNSYKVILTNVNSAHHSLNLTTKNYEIHTPRPEILKAILPGITSSMTYINFSFSDYSFFDNKMDSLRKLNSVAANLYSSTKEAPNTSEAIEKLEEIKKSYGLKEGSSNEKLKEKVLTEYYLISAYIENIEATNINSTNFPINEDFINTLALIKSWKDELERSKPIKNLNYIIESTRAVDHIKVSQPIKAKKDITEIQLALIDNFANDTLYTGVETFYNYGFIGVSFSTGFFYTDGLTDPSYYLETREDGNMSILKEKEPGADVSIGAFANVYYKASPTLRMGPGIGLTISPFDGKSRYLFGGGVLIGKEKMVGITAGVALAKVKRLSNVVMQDEVGYFLPPGSEAVPTYEDRDTSLFLGISYNLFSTRK